MSSDDDADFMPSVRPAVPPPVVPPIVAKPKGQRKTKKEKKDTKSFPFPSMGTGGFIPMAVVSG